MMNYVVECKRCGNHVSVEIPIVVMEGSPLHSRFCYPKNGDTWECPECGEIYDGSISLEILVSVYSTPETRRMIVTQETKQEELESGQAMMLWHMTSDVPMAVHDARVYFESKYGLKPNVVILAEEDAIVDDEDGKKVTLEVIEGLLVATAKWVGKSSAFIGLMDGTGDAWSATV